MEMNFTKLNYYEMLDVKPDAAYFEIRHAYNAALQMYQADSLVSYSFFSQLERKEILTLLEKAYLTLINEKGRQDYDNDLIRLGIITEATKKSPSKMPVCIFDINRDHGNAGGLKSADAEFRAKIAANENIEKILAKQEIRGADLKAIRNELAVPLEKIAQKTKVRIDYLRNMEEENITALPALVFLKGFIKSYLKYLCIEPLEEIYSRYISSLAVLGKKS
jgi:DnaJ-class molecular chaperone